uniref:Membrane protein-like protein n=1 Tax=Geobacter sp. (strain M21) TaxID=443144 RepID=C6E616_GEOSM
MPALKLAPLLICWGLVSLALFRAYPGKGKSVAFAAAAGFCAGAAGENLLLQAGGELPFRVLKELCGALFLALFALSARALYRCGGNSPHPFAGETRGAARYAMGAAGAAGAAVAGGVAGAISLCRLAPGGATAVAVVALALSGTALLGLALLLSRLLPKRLTLDPATLPLLTIPALSFMASSVPRVDLFSPLSMEVMKFVHDFVHQFFESMLIPDHPFFRSDVWYYIGLLFGDKVGFWGGLAIWFAPAFMAALAVRLEPLPSVAQIRQGAERRKQLAFFIGKRRLRLAAPLCALILLSGAAYQSRFPSVEYWDPKPLRVTASAAGEILIPKKGEVELQDGRLHKFIYRQGGREARFFLVATPAGRLTASLDACAICKPDGYGQTGDTVLCYYCKTLIPLETVGKPGGCNPVPVEFADKGESVGIDGMTLLNIWESTVQQTGRGKGEGR